MKRIIIGMIAATISITAAMASDVFPSFKTNPVERIYDWTGIYVGGNVGYATGNPVVTDTNGGVNPGPFGYSANGVTGTAILGGNIQFANFVAGIEGNLGYFGVSGKGVIGSANAAAHQDLTLKEGTLISGTGRLGYAFFNGNMLVYGKGGVATFYTSAKQQTTNPGYLATGSGAFSGPVYGGGLEFAIIKNWSVNVEYLHYDFGSQQGYQTNVSDPSSPKDYRFYNQTALKLDTVNVGVKYRFMP